MIKNKSGTILFLFFIAAVVLLFLFLHKSPEEQGGRERLINPLKEDISVTVVTTGVIEPQNRLEIKSSINGRIEKILVKEGDKVKEGDMLVWMSSSERAALIDAARSQGEEALKYWERVYKKTPVISPINGEVIVRSVEPGQTVTTSDVVLVLSDRLVVSAQFDETDIGRVKIGQRGFITLDAYPDIKIEGAVNHIAYESEVVNNVTIYDVDILPREVPEIIRSGMSVTVEVIEEISKDALTVPSGAIHYDGERTFILAQEKPGKIVERDVIIGLSNNKTTEIISGVSLKDKIIIKDILYLPKRKNIGNNPFMPSRKR